MYECAIDNAHGPGEWEYTVRNVRDVNVNRFYLCEACQTKSLALVEKTLENELWTL